jgi:hypothetical protein
MVLLAVVLASVAAVYFTEMKVKHAREDLVAQDKELKEARIKLQKSGEEREIILRYRGGYEQLTRAGFVGEEKRINWLDALRLANQTADIFGVEYRIGIQHPYTFAAQLAPGQLTILESQMRLNLRMLHEEDLMRFFNSLAAQNAGLYSMDQCFIKRLSSVSTIRFQANLTAECDISWITVVPTTTPDKGGKKP